MESKIKALIAYCSLTGNTEDIAKLLAEELGKLNIQTKVDELIIMNASDFSDYDICVVASYSFDTGDDTVPSEAMDFFDNLGKMNLKGKVFGTLGSGQNDFYENFCGAVDRFYEVFENTGASQGSLPLKFDWDISSKEDEDNLKKFALDLANAAREMKVKSEPVSI